MTKRKRNNQVPGPPRPVIVPDLEGLRAGAVAQGTPTTMTHSTLLIAAALAIVTFASYARVLRNEFVYLDDRVYVTENDIVQKGLTGEGFAWAFQTTHAANWHPLTWLSHMLDCTLFGLNPAGHHFTSVLLHALNVVLLFYLLHRMTRATWPAMFVAGAFGLHPAHVESVAWIAERKDVLSTFFGLLAAVAYLRYIEHRSIARYLVVAALLAFGLMAKPMLVTLPFVFLLLDYWPLGRFRPNSADAAGTVRRAAYLALEKAPLLVLAGISSVITLYAQRIGGAMMTERMLPFELRLSNAAVSCAKYLLTAFWPSGLAVYYPHPLKAHPAAEVAGAAVLLGLLTLLAFVIARTRPYLLVGWCWFLGTLFPVIGLVQVGGQAMADRYTYIPYIGLFIMVAWGLLATPSPLPIGDKSGTPSKTTGGLFPAVAIHGLALASLSAFAVSTVVQTGYWHDSKRLFQRALDVVPNNTQAHIFMAQTLIREGRVADAVPHFAEAVRIVPNEPYNLADYGHALLDAGRVDEAAVPLEQSIKLLPTHATPHYFLGMVRAKQNRPQDAIVQFEEALRLNPTLLRAEQFIGAAYADMGKYLPAIQHLQKWLDIEPESSETLVRVAQCYTGLGNEAAARDALQRAVAANPNDAFALANLAQVVSWSGDVKGGIELYERALKAAPDYVQAANNLAMIYATVDDDALRNVARAIELAERTARIGDYKDPVTLDTLAATYAEAGRFEDAVKTIGRAIEFARSSGNDAFLRELEKRRDLYAAGRSLSNSPSKSPR